MFPISTLPLKLKNPSKHGQGSTDLEMLTKEVEGPKKGKRVGGGVERVLTATI